jgi:hypothetical protein
MVPAEEGEEISTTTVRLHLVEMRVLDLLEHKGWLREAQSRRVYNHHRNRVKVHLMHRQRRNKV